MDIENWITTVLERLKYEFKSKLLFVGLQGSYCRGEATKNSDIDLVVILDKLDFEDLKKYHNLIEQMPNKEKACGFISGKKEIENWSKSDLFQFFYETRNLYGELKNIITPPNKSDIKLAVKIGAQNLYHASVHSFIHSSNYPSDLVNLYKNATFIIQTKYFLKNNKYIPQRIELKKHLVGIEREILEVDKTKITNASSIEMQNLYEKIIKFSMNNI